MNTDPKDAARGCVSVSIIIHCPKDERARQELAQKVADVHVQTVIERVKSMSCPTEQKVQLIDAVKAYIQK